MAPGPAKFLLGKVLSKGRNHTAEVTGRGVPSLAVHASAVLEIEMRLGMGHTLAIFPVICAIQMHGRCTNDQELTGHMRGQMGTLIPTIQCKPRDNLYAKDIDETVKAVAVGESVS